LVVVRSTNAEAWRRRRWLNGKNNAETNKIIQLINFQLLSTYLTVHGRNGMNGCIKNGSRTHNLSTTSMEWSGNKIYSVNFVVN
jgi:hypothetical protein